uniref:Putative phage/plasmid DNA primase n=1 Tax=Bulbochaete rectangularis var. hiloensis TaxID=55990 RepID=A0A6M4SRP9_9CHLO|nr:putative phage/plasmid DNA primase [Bulbochaete rectangularis var. hiloensis]
MKNLSFFFIDNEKTSLFLKDGTLLHPQECARLLLKHTNLKEISIFPLENSFYFFDGFVFQKFQLILLHDVIGYFMLKVKPSIILNKNDISEIYWYIVSSQTKAGTAVINNDLISFDNGVFNLQTKEFIAHAVYAAAAKESGCNFVTKRLLFAYNKAATCPLFEKFLDSLCNGNTNMIFFFKGMASYLTFLISFFYNYTLSLKGSISILSSYILLCSNLRPQCSLDSDIQQLSETKGQAGDALSGTGALFVYKSPVCTYITIQHSLSVYQQEVFLPFSTKTDLPGILNLLLSMKEGAVFAVILKTTEYALLNEYNPLNNLIASDESLHQWIKARIVEGPGAFLGLTKDLKKRKQIVKGQMTNTVMLYPDYINWCQIKKWEPLSLNRFAMNLIPFLRQAGFVVEKLRKKQGMFITQVSLKGVGLSEKAQIEEQRSYQKPVFPESTQLNVTQTNIVETPISTQSEPINVPVPKKRKAALYFFS